MFKNNLFLCSFRDTRSTAFLRSLLAKQQCKCKHSALAFKPDGNPTLNFTLSIYLEALSLWVEERASQCSSSIMKAHDFGYCKIHYSVAFLKLSCFLPKKKANIRNKQPCAVSTTRSEWFIYTSSEAQNKTFSENSDLARLYVRVVF